MDINTYVKKSANDKNFVKLVREFLLKRRLARNMEKGNSYKSFPKGTVVYVKDMRPMPHKKSKPVYFKLPEIVVSEYKCTVYTNDFLGRTRKHSKNNLKIASERSVKLFQCLPADIKLVLGEEFGPEKWLEIKDSGAVPLYLQNIEFEENLQRITRQNLPLDTHLVDPAPVDVQGLQDGPDVVQVEDDEDLDALLHDNIITQIRTLHENEALTNPNVTLHDIPTLFRNMNNRTNPVLPLHVDNEPLHDARDTVPLIDPAGINVDNILPDNTKRHRTVRFNLP